MNSIDQKLVMREALNKIIDASQKHLPGEMSSQEFISTVIEAIDNPRINEAMGKSGK